MTIKFPRYVLPASLIGTTIGLCVIIKDRCQGEKYKGDARLAGKTIIVTGANSGIGKATATELARRGGRIILACRDMKSAFQTRDMIIDETYNKNVEVKQLDLSSLDSIAEFSKDVIQHEKRLDILVNNAGVMTQSSRRQLTSNGFELNLGVNYIGPFLLTNLLLPKMLKSGDARVVNLVTVSMNKSVIDFNDLNCGKNFDPFIAYGQSKLALMSFTKELAERTTGTGLTCYAVNPGVAKTNLARSLSKSKISSTILGSPLSMFMRTPENAAHSVVYCCVEPDVTKLSGNCIKDLKVFDWKTELSSSDSLRLWRISERWCQLDKYKDLVT